MRTMKRAYLYVTRKKGKSVLLFFILLIMAAFVLTGLSIQKASQAAQKNLREALGGEFYVAVELSESNPYFRMTDDGEGALEIYTEHPITEEVIDAVMAISGIEKYDASAQTLVSTNLTVFPGNVPLKGDLNDKVYARTVAGTENNNFFQSGMIELIKGSHITGKERNVAVISRDMADQNSLNIGDVISLQADREAEVKVIGIYEILKPDPAYTSVATYEKLENQIFIDTAALREVLGDEMAGFYEVAFTVSDPAELDSIMSEVRGLSSIDWRAFQVTADNQTYLDAAAPLQKLQAMVSAITGAIVLVSAVILSLILTMWGRSRIHETGVFLSLGMGKMQIIGQYLAEVLMIAVLAFGCSYFVGSTFADTLANGLLRQNPPVSEEQVAGVTITPKYGSTDDVAVSIKDDKDSTDEIENGRAETDRAKVSLEQIDVAIGFCDMCELSLIGTILIVFSVGISALPVMRLKPHEILSKMS